ncbi:MAG: hypothetical protein IPI67_07660 [Myxococcales bacterium]|nr:hypothetical protein [Myxococcales bacterium]
MAYEWDGKPGGQTFAWLVVSTFAEDTGIAVGQDLHSVFPPGITTNEAVIESVAGRSDGLFSIGYDYPEGTVRKQFASLGRVGVEKLAVTVEIPSDGDPTQLADQTAAAWDGEAFAMHAYGAPPQFTLHVARVSESGAVLLPFKQFGQTVNVNYILDGHVTSTNAESGRTYVFDSFSESILNGHLRTGESFTSGPQKIQAVGLPPTSSANMAVVSADSSGAWLGWTQWSETESGKRDAIVQRVDSGGKPSGDAVLFSTEIAKPLGDPSGVWEWAISSQGGTDALVVAATHEGIYSKQITNGIPKDAVVVLDGNGAPELDARDFEIVEAQDERWVFFSEKHQGYVQILRVLKLAEGCVYPAALGAPE